MSGKNKKVLVTTTGRVENKACFSKIPCVTLRDEIGSAGMIESENNILAGAYEKKIKESALKLKKRILFQFLRRPKSRRDVEIIA